jgi:dihydrolipoamide dehydrogenase
MSTQEFDLIVIGAGPGGYVCAIRAAQLGMRVAIVDKRETAGGTCLNVGCIPSKALLNSTHKYWEGIRHFEDHGIHAEQWYVDLEKMLQRKDNVVSELTRGISFLFRKNGITFLHGYAFITEPGTVRVTQPEGDVTHYQARHIVIATGSEPATIEGIDIDEERVVTSTGALSLTRVPKHLVVIGGGYIGLELGSVWARLGAEVTVVEFMDRIVPAIDHEVGAALHKSLAHLGMAFRFNRKVIKVVYHPKELTLHVVPSDAEYIDIPEFISCDTVLVATGRRPYTHGLGLEEIGVSIDARGYILVNHAYQTTCSGIYAIGDVIQGPMLAHKAEEEGVAVAELLAGQAGHVNYEAIPSVIYTSPEVASVGKTEQQLQDGGIAYRVGKFPFMANSRAKTVGETTGFVKVLADAYNDQVLGIHIIGEQAGSMIAEATMAMEYSASSEDIARTCHAHPTFSEALKEAAWAAFSSPIHM